MTTFLLVGVVFEEVDVAFEGVVALEPEKHTSCIYETCFVM